MDNKQALQDRIAQIAQVYEPLFSSVKILNYTAPPGAGKGTQVGIFQNLFGYDTLTFSDDLDTYVQSMEEGPEKQYAIQRRSEGKLIGDSIVIPTFMQVTFPHIKSHILDNGSKVAIEGFGRNLTQANALYDLAKSINRESFYDLSVILTCKRSTMEQRSQFRELTHLLEKGKARTDAGQEQTRWDEFVNSTFAVIPKLESGWRASDVNNVFGAEKSHYKKPLAARSITIQVDDISEHALAYATMAMFDNPKLTVRDLQHSSIFQELTELDNHIRDDKVQTLLKESEHAKNPSTADRIAYLALKLGYRA